MSAEERRLDELLGAFAIDAVDDDERRAVESYLLMNPRARQEVQEHREVASMLAWTGMLAPDGLWERIAAGLDEPAPTPSGELAAVLQLDAGRRPDASSRRRRWGTNLGSWMVASAAAAIVAVLAVTVFGDNGTETRPLAAAIEDARNDRDSTITQLVSAEGRVGGEAVIDQDGHGYLLGGGLPELPESQTYQLWGVVGGKVISFGVLGNNPEINLFSANAAVEQLVITIEVAGGVVSDGNPVGAYAGSVA